MYSIPALPYLPEEQELAAVTTSSLLIRSLDSGRVYFAYAFGLKRIDHCDP